MEAKTTAAKPAAGPLTLVCDLLNKPTTMPPTIPEITPENRGAPDAKATPRHNGRATKNTTIPAGISFFNVDFRMIFELNEIRF